MWQSYKIYVATTTTSNRIPRLEKDLASMGITSVEYNRQIPASKKSKEAITLSCTENHQQIYRKALQRGYKYICVFEDDVYSKSPYYEISRVLTEIELFISNNSSWDFIFLGQFPWMIGDPVHPGSCIYTGVSWCAHAYLISEKAMKYMLNYTPRQIRDIGRQCVPGIYSLFFEEAGGIDTFIAYQIYRRRFESYCIAPMIVYQYSIRNWELLARSIERMCMLFPNKWWTDVAFRVLWAVLWFLIYILKSSTI